MPYIPARSVRDRQAYRKVRLAIAAIDGGAKLLGIPSDEMHDRLKRQGLIHNRLFADYDLLHTQSEKWVIQDTVETLLNWEGQARK